MYIDKGIDIQDGTKIKCNRCKNIIVIRNNEGKFLIKKSIIIYLSLSENICEMKCRECGALNEFTI